MRLGRNWARVALGFVVLAATVVLSSGLSSAQATSEIQVLDVDNADHPSIELSVAIPPELGDGPLTGSDFALTEEGSPRPSAVVRELNAIQVVLAIDTSGSMRPNNALGRAKQAAAQLVDGLPEGTEMGVVGFGSTAVVAGELTTDRVATLAAIDSLSFSGDTALWDALTESGEVIGPDRGASRYVVVLTDGTDDGSSVARPDALEALIEANTSLYAIGLETNETNFAELEDAVSVVGGGFNAAEDLDALSSVFTEIADRLTNRYRLVYETGGTGEQEIVVSVATEGGLATVRQVIDVGGTAETVVVTTTVVPSFPPELQSNVGPSVSGLAQGWSLWLGAGSFFGAFALLAFVMLRPETRVRMATAMPSTDGSSGVSTVPDRVTSAADRFIVGSERGSRIDRALDAAGMEMRPGELTVLVALLAGIAGLALATVNVVLGLLAAVVVVMLAYVVVARKLRNRREAFADQLGDTLTILAGALRAGRGLPQALDLIAEETASPTCDEFRRVIIESRVGRDLTDSLMDVADRMQNDDFRWLAEAVEINRELGGDLAEVLDNIGTVVRDRNQLQLQIRALAAEGRISGYVLVALPVLLFFYIQVFNPDYGRELLRGGGLLALILGIVAIFFGHIWIRKLSKLEF